MALMREQEQANKEMESLRVHADALLSLSSTAPVGSDGMTTRKLPSTAAGSGTDRVLEAEGVFECKTCSRRFSSFQALGGHRTSHTRQQARMLLPEPADGAAAHGAERVRARVHQCAVCGLGFSMGQALGGHMRRHRGDAMPTAPTRPADASSGATQPETMPDLNYPPVEDRGAGDGDQETSADRSSDHKLLDLLV